MSKSEFMRKDDLLTSNQITFMVLGSVIGAGFVSIPNALVKTAYQDAWISAVLSLIYPVFSLFLANYIIKMCPEDNILSINRNIFGNIFGNILNLLFAVPMCFYIFSISSDYTNVVLTYIVAFLKPIKILNISLLIVAYTAYKGLQSLSKANEYIGYLIILLIIMSAAALKHGDIKNLQPVLQTPFKDILKTTLSSIYFFSGTESLLLYCNKAKNKDSIRKSSFIGLLISSIIWVWIILITIYYLGIDIIPKCKWSFILVFESINLPIINNFRYVFMFQWVLMCLRIISNYYYFASFTISDVFKLNRKKVCIYMYLPCLYISYKLTNLFLRKKLIDFLSPVFLVFNVSLLILISIITFIRNKKHAKPMQKSPKEELK
ncbi:endospore germination permease [Haloimpatiens sp. FM7315]|uniref:GerAB/ArcD/ProY family transporter n=1 Tax=Haloimpatiens sp. FM7315 TaxID=3298609 RepID=UPI00370BBE82